MTLKKSTSVHRQTRAASMRAPSICHRLNALLHAMRSIGQFEDALGELCHEVQRSGGLSAETAVELGEILENLPAHDYLHDLDAVRALLREATLLRKATPKGSAKPIQGRKSLAAKKKPKGK